MAEVIPQITIDDSKVKETWVQNEVVTYDVYNAINKAVINLKDNNNLLDSNAMLFREEYNSSSKNLNNAIHQGVYSFTNSAVNAPSGVNGGNLLVTNTSKTNQGSSIITQIAFCHNGAVYARTKNTSENFTSWNKLAYITDNVASATEAGNINKGYLDIGFPPSNFREVVLGRNNIGFCVRPFSSQFADGSYPNSSGVGFGAGDTHGYLQVNYVDAVAYIGGGNNNEINWYKKIAFTESPAFTGTPTAPTPSTSDNSTKIATTAFVKSLFTASKATNGWHKEASTGFIWQWGQEANYHDIMDNKYGSSGSLNFPISFPNECLVVMPYLIGSKTFCCVSVSSFTNATITVHWDEWARDGQSVKFGYIAVGY